MAPPPSSSLPPPPYWVLWQVGNLFSGEKLIIRVALKPQPFPSPYMSFLGKYHFLLVHCFQKSDSQRVGIIASRPSLFLPGRPEFLTPRNSFWLIHYRCPLLCLPTFGVLSQKVLSFSFLLFYVHFSNPGPNAKADACAGLRGFLFFSAALLQTAPPAASSAERLLP